MEPTTIVERMMDMGTPDLIVPAANPADAPPSDGYRIDWRPSFRHGLGWEYVVTQYDPWGRWDFTETRTVSELDTLRDRMTPADKTAILLPLGEAIGFSVREQIDGYDQPVTRHYYTLFPVVRRIDPRPNASDNLARTLALTQGGHRG